MADPQVTRHHPTRAETRGFAEVYALVFGILLTVIGLFEVNGWANPRHDDHAAGTGRGF